MGNQQSDGAANPDTRTIKQMDAEMRRKLGKGEKFNMKIVIFGDKDTGKTSLHLSMQGLPPPESYQPTTSIQTGHVHWNPRRSEDVVKVEVWDVPVISKVKQGLKMSWDDAMKANQPESKKAMQGSFVISELVEQVTLESALIGATAGLAVINPLLPDTFAFAERELNKVPQEMFVVVVALFQDRKAEWRVGVDDMKELAAQRANTFYLECSNRTNQGLQALSTFLELPFLAMQRESLLKRLEINAMEMERSENDLRVALQNNHNPVEVLRKHESSESSSSESASEIESEVDSAEEREKEAERQRQREKAAKKAKKKAAKLKKKLRQEQQAEVVPHQEQEEENSEGDQVADQVAIQATAIGGGKESGSDSDDSEAEKKRQEEKAKKKNALDDFSAGQIDDSFFD